ncbi:MAG: hypothetical protein IBX56_17375 [Methylomicrobium sp.]|nr:hypothetical protein [Methylomicrobium sp.]
MLLHFLHSYNSAIAEEQKSANAMDGVNADFAGAKICPAADILARHTPCLHKTSHFLSMQALVRSCA